MKSWGAELASENKQRDLIKTQLTDIDIQAESIPFCFDMKHGAGRELRPSPMGFVRDLKSLIFHFLDENYRFARTEIF